MKVGQRVRILSGRDAGDEGRISKIYPGAHCGTWPYYFRVVLDNGRNIEAVKTRLKAVTEIPTA